jgi:hypothetical protein
MPASTTLSAKILDAEYNSLMLNILSSGAALHLKLE